MKQGQKNRRAFRFGWLFLGLVGLLAAVGCGPSFKDMSAKQIYDYAQEKYDKKSYEDAIEAYEALIDLYPFSVYVTNSELGIADANFNKRRWVEAEAAYDSFIKQHPKHDRIDHVYYYSGMCGYKQKLSIDRDLAATQKAEMQFSQVVSRFPESSYLAEARLKLREVRNDLAKRERYVARHYWRDKEYYAAFKRYEQVIRLYADTDYYEEALYYAARCLANLDEKAEAKTYLKLLLGNYPEGKYADEAKDLQAKLE